LFNYNSLRETNPPFTDPKSVFLGRSAKSPHIAANWILDGSGTGLGD
jgi:hypothetical protein